MKTTRIPSAFTLIELLVVISIIAILAGIAVPTFQIAMFNARQMDALNNARQIGLALRIYAGDNNGTFPATKNFYDQEITTSNDAFRSLFPTYLTNEKIFTVPRSKTGALADNKIAETADILAAGENHWAFVEGLGDTANSQWPLIVDHTDGTGHYIDKEGELGGTWKGTKAVVINTDISAHLVRLAGTGATRYIPRDDDKKENALDVKAYMGDAARLLEPAQ